MIKLTEIAHNHFKNLMESNNIEAFRFGVSGGGCAGFNYLLEPDSLSNMDDTDEIFEEDGVKIIIDGPSIMFIMGTEIDWVSDIMGSRLEFHNPVSSSSCGCGTSFSV